MVAIAENRWGVLCGLAMILYPRTGLCKGMAEPVWLASEGQARERGSTRPFVRLSPRVKKPEWMSNQSRGLWDTRPMRTFAFSDAVTQDVMDARSRLIPCVSSEASDSPTLLPSLGRNWSIAKAVWRLRME